MVRVDLSFNQNHPGQNRPGSFRLFSFHFTGDLPAASRPACWPELQAQNVRAFRRRKPLLLSAPRSRASANPSGERGRRSEAGETYNAELDLRDRATA